MSDIMDSMFGLFEDDKKLEAEPSKRSDTPSSESQRKVSDILKSAKGRRDAALTSNDDSSSIDAPPMKKLRAAANEELNLAEAMPRIQIHTLDTLESCIHEVAFPPDVDFAPLRHTENPPAKEYPFVLDPFQKQAVLCLENSRSVLVSAHTSAGKTVVAEYAIAISLKNKQRVIYTTPIKALSNQKYRDLLDEFQDVGLMTGDVTINPTASCLVMTTEILRSMLYRGSEIMREVAWVVFDEIHYMRNKERGVVWEETIILLPDNVHYVFLSATIPNARQFAEWICYLHKQPCHVVYTEYRPVPLQHYIFPSGGDGIHLVVDETGAFREQNFNTAMSVLKDVGEAGKGDQKGRKGGMKEGSNCFKIVKMIMERNFAPVIVFSFSKKDCEAYAVQMTKLDFNTDEEKKLVEEVFKNAIDCLSEDDQKLPQIEQVLPLLKKGIGIHHSGLLPLLKETIEILFHEGLIKTLFATETFAMGLNMPARTVLFTSGQKFDGKEMRWISSGEYIQMSGRAGRRGLDDKGIVILTVDQKMTPGTAKNIVKGLADPLNSAFRLTYNMVLNLLRVEEINPEYMLERSFHQFQNYASIPGLVDKLKSLEKTHAGMMIDREDEVAAYHKIRQQLLGLEREMQAYLQKPQYILPFLQPGRLVKVVNGEDDFGWAVVINFQRKANQSATPGEILDPIFIVEVLLHLSKESVKSDRISAIKPCPKGEKGEMQVVPVLLSLVTHISSVRLYIPKDLRPSDNRMVVLKSLLEVQNRFKDGVPNLDPIEDMGIKDKGFVDVIKKTEAFEKRMYAHALHKSELLDKLYAEFQEKVKVGNDIKVVKSELKKKRSLLQMDELKCRKRVLRRLGYCTASDVIEMKGRVACEVDSCDELLVTELLLNGVFNDLTPAQIASLMSCFVFQENSSEMPKLTQELGSSLRVLQETAKRIAKISIEAKLQFDESEYLDSFKPHMMDVVHSWCNGSTFLQICKITDIFEGSVIRCMRRLEEALRQMCGASKAIGNTELENKFSESIRLIKRDIVFAASLYL